MIPIQSKIAHSRALRNMAVSSVKYSFLLLHRDRLRGVFICAPWWKLKTFYVLPIYVYIYSGAFLKWMLINGPQTKTAPPLFLNRLVEMGANTGFRSRFSIMNKNHRAGRYGWNHYHNMKKAIFQYQLCITWDRNPHMCKRNTVTLFSW